MQEITISQLKQMLDAGEEFTLIDVREADELAEKPFTGAAVKHIPMMQIGDYINDLNKDAKTVVMCAKGGRSGKITTLLMIQGFSNVINLNGGVDAWYEEGFAN